MDSKDIHKAHGVGRHKKTEVKSEKATEEKEVIISTTITEFAPDSVKKNIHDIPELDHEKNEHEVHASANIIVICLVVVILLLVGLIISMFVLNIEKKGNETETHTSVEQSKEETDRPVENEDLRDDLIAKASAFLWSYDKDDNGVFKMFAVDDYLDRFYNNKINDDDKMRAAIMATAVKKYDVGVAEQALSESEVANSYKALFNEKIKLNQSDKQDDLCPAYAYNEGVNVYNISYDCETEWKDNHSDLAYISDVTEYGKKAYVNIRVGSIKLKYDNSNNFESATIFNDSYTNDKRSTVKTTTKEDDAENFLINSTNFSDFARYRIVFEKNDDGNYSFKEVEKL